MQQADRDIGTSDHRDIGSSDHRIIGSSDHRQSPHGVFRTARVFRSPDDPMPRSPDPRSVSLFLTTMIREFSSGAIVLRHMKDQWWVAAIEPGREGEPEDRKHTVALPKGNIDPGEKPLETAVREVREETGLVARPITKLADIKYIYTQTWAGNNKVFKIF